MLRRLTSFSSSSAILYKRPYVVPSPPAWSSFTFTVGLHAQTRRRTTLASLAQHSTAPLLETSPIHAPRPRHDNSRDWVHAHATPIMSSTLEDAEKNARQVQAKPVKLSQIPSRPASGLEIRRARPHDFSISTAGSPQATAAPPATPTPMSAMAVSNIPKAPQTPSNAPVPKSLNSKSAAGHRSSLPVPRCGHKLLIPQSPPALVCGLLR
jgi:hypothetical protein